MPLNDSEVLIVGAGPTGLVLALWLARLGVRLRIVDKAAEPGTTSRALAVQARTLEFYRQLGIADEVVADGLAVRRRQSLGARHEGRARRRSATSGRGISPFPFMLILPQDEHERLLIEPPCRRRRRGRARHRAHRVRGGRAAACGRACKTRRRRGDAATAPTSPAATAPIRACARRWASASRAAPTTSSSTSPTPRRRARS